MSSVQRSDLTVRVKILTYLAHDLPSVERSATRIARAIDEKAADVSSILHSMWLKGHVTRVPNGGPRGGYVYYLPEQ